METVTHGRINMLELTVVEGYLWIVVNEDSFPTDTFIECSTQFNVRGLRGDKIRRRGNERKSTNSTVIVTNMTSSQSLET